MNELEAFRKLDKLFRRFSLMKMEMMPYTYVVQGIIHNGMGDFSTFESRQPTLSEAVENVINQYCLQRGVGRAELERWFNEPNERV